MHRRASKPGEGPKSSVGAAVLSVGVLATLVICCAGPAVIVGALGGLAFGGALGVGAGVLATVLLAAGVVVLRRRRASRCALPSNEGRPA